MMDHKAHKDHKTHKGVCHNLHAQQPIGEYNPPPTGGAQARHGIMEAPLPRPPGKHAGMVCEMISRTPTTTAWKEYAQKRPARVCAFPRRDPTRHPAANGGRRIHAHRPIKDYVFMGIDQRHR